MAEDQNVAITAWPNESARVDLMVHGKEPFPVCIKVCEPICAVSNYEVGIDVFDRPVVTIRVKGTTRIFNCREKEG